MFMVGGKMVVVLVVLCLVSLMFGGDVGVMGKFGV